MSAADRVYWVVAFAVMGAQWVAWMHWIERRRRRRRVVCRHANGRGSVA